MFSLPDSPGVNVCEGDTPVVDMQEPASILGYLLRFCYPIENPKIPDKIALQKVIAAAQEFGMESLYGMIVESYITNARVPPMEQYGLSHRYRLSLVVPDIS